MDQLNKLFTVEDIATMTSLTTRTIRNYLKDGSLKGKKIGGQWRFTMDDIQSFMSNDRVAENLCSETKQAVLDFIDGVNTDISGEIQVCSIVDIYCDSTSAIETRDKISEYINNPNSEYSFLKFAWEYNVQEEKARFTLFGSPEFIINLMQLLK